MTSVRRRPIRSSSRAPVTSPHARTAGPQLRSALEAAGLDPRGLTGQLRQRGCEVSPRTVRSWLRTAGPDREAASITDEILRAHGRLFAAWWPVDDGTPSTTVDPPRRLVEQEDPEPTPSPKPRFRRFAIPVGVVVVAAGASGITLAVTHRGRSGPAEAISGTATCQDGDPIVGVYIKADNGGSAFAHTLGAGNTKNFSLVLPHGGPWTANVGCGGTPAHWLHSPMGVGSVKATRASWTCVTADQDGGREYCRPV